jgi:ADP-ribose pyrophosphatase YjhB (NUDIX family)
MERAGCHVHKLVADVCLISDDGVLLVRYQEPSGYDGERGWFLPDDFLRHSEHPDGAAKRILRDRHTHHPERL